MKHLVSSGVSGRVTPEEVLFCWAVLFDDESNEFYYREQEISKNQDLENGSGSTYVETQFENNG